MSFLRLLLHGALYLVLSVVATVTMPISWLSDWLDSWAVYHDRKVSRELERRAAA